MIATAIQSGIETLETNAALFEEVNFNKRAEALDFIEFHIIDRMEGLLQREELKEKLKNELNRLQLRANKLKAALEEIDIHLFQQLREQIRTAAHKTFCFSKILQKYLGAFNDGVDESYNIGYDNLDSFINGLLSYKAIPEQKKMEETEMVFYQKTPARIIFTMSESANIKSDDVFFDIGSGLGQVVLLMNLMSGVTAKGIEYEPAFCDYANEVVSELNLSHVEFINADAREVDYSQGTIFFMYTPFEGKMMEDMLELLQKQSRKRVIRIFTYGPCSIRVAGQNWLMCLSGKVDDIYKLYEFKSLMSKESG
ncbi:MAG: hypothetical protein IPO83_00770 [Chitinophagaceae bacterium]|nr:hypothetical protein [Chitinophagaceae bacterium]